MQLVHTARGVSMIEVLLYLALASLLITGIIASSYPLFTNTERQTQSTIRDLEAAFVTQKIILTLNSASAITVPTVGSPGSTLTVVTVEGPVSITRTGGVITLDRGAGAVPLTSSWVTADDLSFTRTSGALGAPDALSFGFTLNGVAVPPTTRYVKN